MSFSIGPRWGVTQGDALDAQDAFAGRIGGTPATAALSMQADYAFGYRQGVLTPFVEIDFGDSRRYAARLGYAVPGGLDVNLTRKRHEPETGEADNRINFDLRLAF